MQVPVWTVNLIQDYSNDKLLFEITGFPYNGPGAGETYKVTVLAQHPLGYRPNSDGFEVTWSVINGPTAIATVTDKLCYDCTATGNVADDPTTQSFEIVAWDSPADRCVAVSGSVCEILTAKVERKWSSFSKEEDLELSEDVV